MKKTSQHILDKLILNHKRFMLKWPDGAELNLVGKMVTRVKLKQINLTHSNLILSAWVSSVFDFVKFYRSDISNSIFSDCKFRDVNLSKTNANGVSFRGSLLCRVDFTDSALSGADFRGCELYKVRFKGSNLKGALFDENVVPDITS